MILVLGEGGLDFSGWYIHRGLELMERRRGDGEEKKDALFTLVALGDDNLILQVFHPSQPHQP